MATNKDKIRAAAQRYLQRGNIDKAIREYQRLVEEDPKDVRTILKIGDLHTRKGDHLEATKAYDKVANTYAEQGFFLKAVAVYKQILKLDSTLVDVNVKLGDLYQQLGLIPDALHQFRQVYELYEAAGRTTEAAHVLRQMVELDPDNVATRIKLADFQLSQGMVEEAQQDYRRAAAFLKQQERIDEYIKVAQRILHNEPGDVDTGRDLAALLLERGEARQAIARLQACFRVNPRDTRTLMLLAKAFLATGQQHKTVSVFRELARVYAVAGNLEGRRAALARVLELNPNDSEARAFFAQNATSGAFGQAASMGAADAGAGSAAADVAAADVRAEAAEILADREAVLAIDPDDQLPLLTGLEPLPGDAADTLLGDIDDGVLGPDDAVLDELEGGVQGPVPAPVSSAGDEVLAASVSEPVVSAADAEAGSGTGVGGSETGGGDTFAGAQPTDPDQFVVEAEIYVKYGLRDKAIEHLARVFDLDPGHSEARRLYKTLLFDERGAAGAVAALWLMARKAVAGGHFAAARQDLKELLGLDPTYQDARELLGQLGASELTPSAAQAALDATDGAGRSDASSAQATPGAAAPDATAAAEASSVAKVAAGPQQTTAMHDAVAATAAELEADFLRRDAGSAEGQAGLDADLGDGFEMEVEVEVPQTPDFFDLTAALADEFSEPEEVSSEEIFEEVFAKFKKGVAENFDESDSETHFNLGIAYKEMGLYEDAIAEFGIAQRSPQLSVSAQTMAGLCYLELQKPEEAIRAYVKALNSKRTTQEESVALRYELGIAYEALGRLDEAIRYYSEAQTIEPGFRHVSQRLSLLAQQTALRGGAQRAAAMPATMPGSANVSAPDVDGVRRLGAAAAASAASGTSPATAAAAGLASGSLTQPGLETRLGAAAASVAVPGAASLSASVTGVPPSQPRLPAAAAHPGPAPAQEQPRPAQPAATGGAGDRAGLAEEPPRAKISIL